MTEIPHGSRDHVIVPEILKIMFDLDIESKDKTRSIANNVNRVLILSSNEIETINNSDIYDTYNDPYFSEKESEEKRFQGIQSGNGLKAQAGAKRQMIQQ